MAQQFAGSVEGPVASQLGTRAPAEPNLRILKGPPGSQPRCHGAMVLFCHLATCLSKLIAAALTALQQNSRASNPRKHAQKATFSQGFDDLAQSCWSWARTASLLQEDSVNCSNILYYRSSNKSWPQHREPFSIPSLLWRNQRCSPGSVHQAKNLGTKSVQGMQLGTSPTEVREGVDGILSIALSCPKDYLSQVRRSLLRA